MTTTAFFGVVLALDFLAVVCQPYCAPLPALFGARLLLFPVILAYGALALPFWAALALAFFNGLLWDALTMQIINTSPYLQGSPVVEIALGGSVALFGVLVILVHGLRPLFLRGRWELHCLASGVCVVVILAEQFALVVFHRGGLVLPREFWRGCWCRDSSPCSSRRSCTCCSCSSPRCWATRCGWPRKTAAATGRRIMSGSEGTTPGALRLLRRCTRRIPVSSSGSCQASASE